MSVLQSGEVPLSLVISIFISMLLFVSLLLEWYPWDGCCPDQVAPRADSGSISFCERSSTVLAFMMGD